MPHTREVRTCDRCRHFKRRCDLLKPSCTRCVQAGVRCSFDAARTAVAGAGAQQPSVAAASSSPPVVVHDPPAPTFVAVNAPTSSATAAQRPSSLPSSSFDAVVVAGGPASDPDSHPFSGMPPAGGRATSVPPAAAAAASSSISPGQDDAGAALVNGLISPTTSAESPEPPRADAPAAPTPLDTPAAMASSASGQRVVRKRKRNCLSCLRCHRLKVKCDKELPCGRCVASGNGRECYYSYNKGPNGGKFPCPTAPVPSSRDEKKPQMVAWQVQHRVRGSSHWRELMTKIGSLASSSATGEQSPLAAALEGVGTNACLANFCLPGNFPFGTPGAAKYYSRDAVTRLLAAERARTDDYLRRYLALLDVVNPIVDLRTFGEEIDGYWRDPNEVSLCWLSQFLMVVGLGCFTSTADEPSTATELMMAAEACLMQTPFMFRPTLMTLRALSLMSVAKLVCNATCWSVDSCWSLLGLLVRVAFIFGLPQEKNDQDEELRDPVEKDARRKLWLTILYLDIKVSMCTGMPPLTRPDELGGMRTMPDAPDDLQMVLFRSLPTVLSVLAQINSKKDQMAYADVLRFNARLRELMGHAQRVCTASLQRITVDIFLRRCLMVLHRPFALHPEGPSLFPESYWSSLECSLALLVHYRELWCSDEGLRLDLVGRAFVLDFFSATLTTCVHMLREDAPLSGAAATGCRLPPRQLILDTLRSCVDIWSGEQEKSVCWRTGYHLLRAVLALLPSAVDGPDEPLPLAPPPPPQPPPSRLEPEGAS
ncbi:C6 transcription factor [Drechmeria coniospora]|uniref:C6 transcription factor n=1 Tax=Drechmeria coniospora TaxID=98403 RepID=A0A151GUV3_DRECN|nr:C6 transcription factor [Drechmeria coniospora]KYK60802.1 C6 transcription factor [Drechmeria coniospora]